MVRDLQVILTCRRKQFRVCRFRSQSRLRARDAAILHQRLKRFPRYLRQRAVFSQQADGPLTGVHDRRDPPVPHDRRAWSEVDEPRTLPTTQRILDAPVRHGRFPIRKNADLLSFHQTGSAKVHKHIACRNQPVDVVPAGDVLGFREQVPQ